MLSREAIGSYFKNIPGPSVRQKYVVFTVDDYGNIRLREQAAKSSLRKLGVRFESRFDEWDALDTREDYEALFEVLSNIKNKNGQSPVFTPYALPCNIDFEATLVDKEYRFETLDKTYNRLASEDVAYQGAYQIMREGISKNLICPQFHGREHLNVNLINRLLHDQNSQLMANLECRSMVSLPEHIMLPGVVFTQAFAFWDPAEIESHKIILKDGLDKFEQVYGYRSATFTAPAQQLHPSLWSYIADCGVRGIDRVRAGRVHTGFGNFKSDKNTIGTQGPGGTVKIVRNCVFEPCDSDIDWVNLTINQIKAAFFWNKPAVISSHRVNFCGHIDQKNRNRGLAALKELLQKVVSEWPEVEFVTVPDLVKIFGKQHWEN